MHRHVLLTTPYRAVYDDPIAVRRGDRVQVEHDDPEYAGWWWCIGPDGRVGWVPAALLDPAPAPGIAAVLRADYTARELTLAAGERVAVLETRDGWLFVRDAAQRTGWIPEACVAPEVGAV